MNLYFRTLSEPSPPDTKWKGLYTTFWPAYVSWLSRKRRIENTDLNASQAALKEYMPEMWSTYERICTLADYDELAMWFLTGYQPPAYLSACSQAVQTTDVIQLVRNYDYHAHYTEGTLLLTKWNGKKVIATSDCLAGVTDGMNEDGLVVSLTFGGRKVVGKGFGIPFILRYILEFCSDVQEATKALVSIPSHMSYNITILDKSGAYKTILVAPDRPPKVTGVAFTTNHQTTVEWPEVARFNQTLERAFFLKRMLSRNNLKSQVFIDAFLKPPLYSNHFAEGFGTLYTAIYRPLEGEVQLRWPGEGIRQSFDNFQEIDKVIKLGRPVNGIKPLPTREWENLSLQSSQWTKQAIGEVETSPINELVNSYEKIDAEYEEVGELTEEGKFTKTSRDKEPKSSRISLQNLANFWRNVRKSGSGK